MLVSRVSNSAPARPCTRGRCTASRRSVAAAAAGKEEPRSFRSLFRDIVRGMGKETREPGYAPGTLAGAAAQVLKAQGKMAEAEPLLKLAVPTLVSRLGESDPEALAVVLSYAALLQSQGKKEDLDPLIRDILPRAKYFARADQDETLRALSAAAQQLVKEGRLDDADGILRDVLGSRQLAVGGAKPTLRSISAKILGNGGRTWSAAAPPPVLSPPRTRSFPPASTVVPSPIPATYPASTPTPASTSAPALPPAATAADLSPSVFSSTLSLEPQFGAPKRDPAAAGLIGRVSTEPFVSAARPTGWAGALGGAVEDSLLQRALQSTTDVRTGKFKDMNGLAAYISAKTLAERAVAEPLYRQALADSRAKLGPRHLDTITFMIGLAACLKESAEPEKTLEESEALFREGLEGIRVTLGDFHPDTLVALMNLSKLLMARGDLPESERYCRAALSLARELLGDLNKTTLAALNSLAIVLYAQGSTAEAENLLRESGRIKTSANFAAMAAR